MLADFTDEHVDVGDAVLRVRHSHPSGRRCSCCTVIPALLRPAGIYPCCAPGHRLPDRMHAAARAALG